MAIFKKIRSVTLPLLKMQTEREYFVKFAGPMRLGKKVEANKEAATLAEVTDLETGELNQIIVGSALASILREEYPGDGYVGKCFGIVKQAPRNGKKYATFIVSEVAEPDELPTPTARVAQADTDRACGPGRPAEDPLEPVEGQTVDTAKKSR